VTPGPPGDLLIDALRELVGIRAGEVLPGGDGETLAGSHGLVHLVGKGPEATGQAQRSLMVELDIRPVAVQRLNLRCW
jgi:hypothetical protein